MFNTLLRGVALTAVVVASMAGSASAASIPTPTATAAPAPVAGPATGQGIIMRDGGICNPRWGC
jgi:hypothetical protein